MTDAQKAALRWLMNRNGDGLFDRNGVLVAAGERAPVRRITWNALRDEGLVELYCKNKRLKTTDKAHSINLRGVVESGPALDAELYSEQGT